MNTITVEKIEQVFAYGRLENLVGTSLPNELHEEIGNNMNWEDKPYFYKGYKDIPAQNVPANIKWYNNPIFAYVGIVDGQVEYRYSERDDSAFYICPITEDKKHIALIDSIFDTWYRHFNLPESLSKLKTKRPKIDRSDKLQLIKNYLTTASDEDFEILMDEDDIAFWVDWREEDESIIGYCESIIKTGNLTTHLNDMDNETGFELLIDYNGIKHKVPYIGKGADRDTTIITLNEVIKPDFEIRFCKSSGDGDTLAFLPLTSQQWNTLENEFGKNKVTKLFVEISKTSKLFS
jgi:hypothetical protein